MTSSSDTTDEEMTLLTDMFIGCQDVYSRQKTDVSNPSWIPCDAKTECGIEKAETSNVPLQFEKSGEISNSSQRC